MPDARRKGGSVNLRSRTRPVHRAGVRTYLLATFGACLAALVALMAMTTTSSFHRERGRAEQELEAAAQENARWADETMPGALEVLSSVATQPGITHFDVTECGDVFSGLSSIAAQGHLHLFRPDRSQVCSLHGPEIADSGIPMGDWFEQTITTQEPVNGGTAIDPLSGHAAITIALPVDGGSGQVGVLAVVLYTDAFPIDLPAGASPSMVILQLDPERKIVLATSADSPVKSGPLGDSWLSRPLGAQGATVEDVDGVTRIYREMIAPESRWPVLAGMPRGVALASAERELHRNLWVGLFVLLVVAGLGLTLQRRIARPASRLRHAIEAARTDNSARAPVEGPAELAAVAEAFNATIAQRRALERELAHQALHDPLTSLPNRTLLVDRLSQALARQARAGGTVAVAFMDLDRFKLINDSKGHPAGDALLVSLARRLESVLRAGDTVPRFGGDEFVMVAEGTHSDDEVASIAQRLAATLHDPFMVAGEEIRVSGRVGLAVGHGG
jgi:diguanylate cyclase (GGDEF)-like protein